MYKKLFLSCLVSASFSCSVRTQDNSQTSMQKDKKGDASREVEIIELARIKGEEVSSTLAYSVGTTGCDYRAYYLSMELAAHEIVSAAFYGMAHHGFKLVPKEGVTWEYHVAPSFFLDGEEFILDPTMRALGKIDSVLMKKNQWMELLGARKQPFWEMEDGDKAIREYYFSSSFTLLENLRVREQGSNAGISGDALVKFSEEQERRRNMSFSEMPPFSMRDINEVCKSLMVLLSKENSSSQTQQKVLIDKIEDLSQRLDAKGKLLKDTAFSCQTR